MRILLILISLLLVGCNTDEKASLPNCPSDTSIRWDNCFGTYTWDNGNQYVGEWKDDEMHGQGTLTFTSGNKYVGAFKDGMYHGQGTYTWVNGDHYVGEWKDDMYHGQGTYTWADGAQEVGFYFNDQYIPDICEGMGLVKGTQSFGSCVSNLIANL